MDICTTEVYVTLSHSLEMPVVMVKILWNLYREDDKDCVKEQEGSQYRAICRPQPRTR